KAADHGVARPAQRGNGQQQIRLVRDPVPAGAGARALMLGGRHGVLAIGPRFTDAVARPDLTTGPVLPGSLKDTDFDLVSTAQDASRPCAWASSSASPRTHKTKKPPRRASAAGALSSKAAGQAAFVVSISRTLGDPAIGIRRGFIASGI